MKEQKRLNYGLLGTLMLCIVACLFLARPMKVEAAPSNVAYLWTEGDRVKSGNHYFWISQNKLYASTSKKGKGKVIAKPSKGRYVSGSIVFDGSKVYYTEAGSTTSYIYSVKINGKSRKLISKLKDVYCIQAYYNGKLYIAYGNSYDMHTYCLDTKTKKGKRIMKNATPFDQHKQYLLLANGCGADVHKAYIYNCKTGKSVKISNKVMYDSLNFSSGKAYYAEKINNTTVRIMRCDLNGKNKKTVVKKLSADPGNVGKISSSYVYYIKMDKKDQSVHYCYNIKTKKSKKISPTKFKW